MLEELAAVDIGLRNLGVSVISVMLYIGDLSQRSLI